MKRVLPQQTKTGDKEVDAGMRDIRAALNNVYDELEKMLALSKYPVTVTDLATLLAELDRQGIIKDGS